MNWSRDLEDPVGGTAIPCHADAQRSPCLLATALVDAPGSLDHLLHRVVLAKAELVDHGGAVLDHSHLQTENRTIWDPASQAMNR